MPKKVFKKGHKKEGGREKGTPNKKTILKKALTAMGINSLDDLEEPLVNIARKMIYLANESNDFDHLERSFKALAEFRFPKKRIIDIPDTARKILVIHKTEKGVIKGEGGKEVEITKEHKKRKRKMFII